jgi:hypothetical protein
MCRNAQIEHIFSVVLYKADALQGREVGVGDGTGFRVNAGGR